jgi:hypothetical protein
MPACDRARARARGGGRGGWACEDARGPAPPRPGVWPAGETREGAAVNPFLPDLKLGASGPSARGLPQHVAGGQSWLGEDPSREQRAPPGCHGNQSFPRSRVRASRPFLRFLQLLSPTTMRFPLLISGEGGWGH